MLFGGNLGKLKGKKTHITLKEGTKPYAGQYYNLLKAYKVPTQKEIDRMVTIGIMKKLKWNKDSCSIFLTKEEEGSLDHDRFL